MAGKNTLWVEKYRPKTLDEYIFQSEKEAAIFRQIVASGDIPHLLLQGVQGSGKTTLAKILISEAGVDESDVLVINASDERGIDTFRDKIDGFISSFPVGRYRVVLLEEADMLPVLSQAVLRNPLEQFSESARFILTCNYGNKIIPAVKSRCQTFTFKAPDKQETLGYALDILDRENVKASGKVLKTIVDVYYPDVRKIINVLQQNSSNGALSEMIDSSGADDYKFKILELLERDDWKGIRNLICENVSGDNEWSDIYRFLYDNLHKSKKFSDQESWEAGITIIAEHLYKSALVAVQEINMVACVIRLGQI
jgi:DNA polymerase III delta prime subunit